MSNRETAESIAKAIFDAPQGIGTDRTQRIAFKGGKWPLNETDLGGLSFTPLVDIIEDELRRLAQPQPGSP